MLAAVSKQCLAHKYFGYLEVMIRIKTTDGSGFRDELEPVHCLLNTTGGQGQHYIRFSGYNGVMLTTEINHGEMVHLAMSRFFRVLGDPTRLRLLELINQGPKSVGELVASVGVSQARVSSHLACLRWCDFVDTRREGRHIIYSISDPEISSVIGIVKSLSTVRQQHLASCKRIGPSWS